MKNWRRLFWFLLCITTISTPTFAASESCMQLFHSCQASKKTINNDYHPKNPMDLFNSSYCIGYFEGFANAMTGIDSQIFCLPDNSSTGQLTLVYLKWANAHPERLHEPAGICAAAALSEAFPCSKKN